MSIRTKNELEGNLLIICKRWNMDYDTLLKMICADKDILNFLFNYQNQNPIKSQQKKVLLDLAELTGTKWHVLYNRKLNFDNIPILPKSYDTNDNELIVRKMASDFIFYQIRYLGQSIKVITSEFDKLSFIQALKKRLLEFYEIEDRTVFLNQIKQTLEYQIKIHPHECSEGENCSKYLGFKNYLFFTNQEKKKLSSMDIKTESKKIFLSYSHKDEQYKEELEVHFSSLLRQKKIKIWQDRLIKAGEDWNSAIMSNLADADIICLLISPDFIASDFCYKIETEKALELRKEGAIVVPIIIRPCDWTNLSIGEIQALPKNGKPIIKWENRDDAYLDVVKKIKSIL